MGIGVNFNDSLIKVHIYELTVIIMMGFSIKKYAYINKKTFVAYLIFVVGGNH